MSIILFFIVLFVLVLVHELGHFIVAKKTGMRVDEFGIGFPPRLFGITKGETTYTLNALPIGGFVRIYGENLDEQTDTTLVAEGSFAKKSKWAQVAVLIAGVTMNIIFAWLLFVFVFMYGVPTVIDEATSSETAELVVADVIPLSPADRAGITNGARISEVYTDNESLEELTPQMFAEFAREHSTDEILITYHDGGNEQTVAVTPQEGVVADDAGRPAVGVALSLVDTVQHSLIEAITKATETSLSTLVAITVGITGLLIEAVTFSADLSGVSGPVGIVGMVGDAAEFGLASLLLFTAIISLNLAVINMLPFPALDGGRLLFVAIEAVLRRPLNPVWAGRANLVGFALLMLLMIAVTYNDILRLV